VTGMTGVSAAGAAAAARTSGAGAATVSGAADMTWKEEEDLDEEEGRGIDRVGGSREREKREEERVIAAAPNNGLYIPASLFPANPPSPPSHAPAA
jgi:hypothetical protein